MSALGVYRAIRIGWTNSMDSDLARIEVWTSASNDRATAVLIATPAAQPGVPQTYIHGNVPPGTTRYYWIRAQDRSGNLSAWMPVGATAGWVATSTGLPDEDLAGIWVYVASASQAMGINTGYLIDFPTLCTLTLPAIAARFTGLKVVGRGVGLWRIAQNAGQQIRSGVMQSTVGVTGYIQSRNVDDVVTLRCVMADTLWTIETLQATLTMH